eukprot:873588-Rhodomonas_salina.2
MPTAAKRRSPSPPSAAGPCQQYTHNYSAALHQDASARQPPVCFDGERTGGCGGARHRDRGGVLLRGRSLRMIFAVFLLSATTDGLGMLRDGVTNSRVDPEYACVYERNRNPPGLLDQISAAHRYKQYLTAQNRILRRKIARVCSVPENEGTSLSSISQSRELQPEDCTILQEFGSVADSPWTVPPMDGLSDDEGMWRADVNERYKELVPPKRQPSLHAGLSDVCLRKAAEAALSSSSSASISPQAMEYAKPVHHSQKDAGGMVEEAVLLLDLDKCSFYGNDGNDLGIALQWMDKGYDDVMQLYRLLFNPNVKKTYEGLKKRAKKVNVVIYTMRATFLVYRSCFRDAVIPLRWKPVWHHGSQVHFPASATSADAILSTYSADVKLIEEERTDLRKSLERLLATRDIIAEQLGLSELPNLAVTATPKNVEGTVSALGFPIENAYLWDDNTRLRDNPRVVSVPPFEALPPAQCDALQSFLAERLPAASLEAALVDFMMGADDRDRVLDSHPVTGELIYRIPRTNSLPKWPLPDLVPAGSTSLPSPFGREISMGSSKDTGH